MSDSITATRMGGRTYLFSTVDGSRGSVDTGLRISDIARTLRATGWTITVNTPTALLANR